MRNDPHIYVECDGPNCDDSVEVPAPFPYNHRTTDAEEDAEVTRAGWIVSDGKDFCCEECRDGQEREDAG